ncbi:Glutamate receptor ionotropic, NMDA 3A [Acipenser ruthenus]|uniref:Glutamate receptor ionotropic, NMDA 3A n=1 Tax=Acipenser ruthenus TaxID=7906 RepID=A0A444UV66_ACIRT|nr:Glutamate receptor ionotropic, NMDA 3A [Acipenser ruthenus]
MHICINSSHSHPQPCHILAQIGHTVRLGALMPTRQPARVQGSLNRALSSLSQTRGNNLLPYNLSLELVYGEPLDGDPESLFRCVCQAIAVRGVSAVLAFPQTPEELIQMEFLSSFLEIPFISILEHGEPLDTGPARVQGSLNRALSSLSQTRGNNLLPYNLSLELVYGEPLDGDPESLFRCVCQAIAVRGVSAVLAFPQTPEELIQMEFLSSFLEIPFISILEHGEPLDTGTIYTSQSVTPPSLQYNVSTLRTHPGESGRCHVH